MEVSCDYRKILTKLLYKKDNIKDRRNNRGIRFVTEGNKLLRMMLPIRLIGGVRKILREE